MVRQKVNFIRRLLILLGILLLPAATPSNCRCAETAKTVGPVFTREEILDHIQAKAKNLKNFQGHFHQFKFSRLLKAPLKSEGTFYWEPPDRFRWEVVQPVPFQLTAQGSTILLYYPDMNRATLYRQPTGNDVPGKFTGTTNDTESLERAFRVERVPILGPEAREWVQLRLEPRSAAQARYLKRIEVMIDPTTWLPQRILIQENNEDQTVIHLSQCTENGKMAENLFSVEPPAGAQVERFGKGRQP